MGTTSLAAAALLLSLGAGSGTHVRRSLSGAWWFGDYEPEPRKSVIEVPDRCEKKDDVNFTLKDRGKTLTGEARWIEVTPGMPRSECVEAETLSGTRDGDHIVLTGQHKIVTCFDPRRNHGDSTSKEGKQVVKYDLRFDPKTGHLVGTRDGKPLWLARFVSTGRRLVCGTDCGSKMPRNGIAW
jgi:hypothetical protein